MKEHNPIALAISLLQNKWIEATKNKDYNLYKDELYDATNGIVNALNSLVVK